MAHQTPEEQSRARRRAWIATEIEALSRGREGWPVTSWPRPRRDAAGFTDDLRGLSRAEQIARVQAVAREHGDRLTAREAVQALGLYVTQAPGDRAGPQGHDGAEAEAD
jgi:hypothetical protein